MYITLPDRYFARPTTRNDAASLSKDLADKDCDLLIYNGAPDPRDYSTDGIRKSFGHHMAKLKSVRTLK